MAFEDQHYTPTAITTTRPPVVTVVAHGLLDGQFLRATRFYNDPPAFDTGIEQINNRIFVVRNGTTDTFELWNAHGFPVDGRGFTAFSGNDLGLFTRVGPELNYENEI